EPGVEQRGLTQAGNRRDAHALAVEPRAAATPRAQQVAGDRVVDDADGDLARVLEPDQRGPDGHVADEVLGAVDRVDDPASPLIAHRAELLAEEPVLGKRAAEHLADDLLGALVGLRHRRRVRLQRHVEARAVVLHRALARRTRGLGRGGQRAIQLGWRHFASSPGNGSPRSVSTLPYTSRSSTTP